MNSPAKSLWANFWTIVLGLQLFFTAPLLAHTKVPPVARTDSPGDGSANCSECHGGSLTRNSPSISVSNLPTTFVPSQKYSVTVALGAGSKFGFEATAEKVSNAAKVGTWEAGANNEVIIPSWVGHSNANTTVSSWTFSWTAPPAGTGDVRFYVVGLAANNNNNSSGDAVHLRSWLISEIAGPPTIGEIVPNFGSAQQVVTLSGSNFGANTGSVRFNSVLANIVSWADQSITVKVPAGAASGLVTVTKGAETSSGLPFSVLSAAPSPSAVNPNSSAALPSFKLRTVNGNNFSPGASIQLTRAGQSAIPGTGVSVSSSTLINAVTFNLSTAFEGSWNLVITNPDGQAGTLNNAISIYRNPPNPPTALSVE